MSQSDRAITQLAKELGRLKKEVVSWRGAQTDYTSVENGGNVTFNDSDGNVASVVGGQGDGGNTVNVLRGPTPPTPTGFTVEVDHGKFIVHWSGDFDGDKLAPSDWSRAEVHASQDPFFVPDRSTARGSIVSAAGGEVTIGVLKGEWTIKMLAWSQAGKMSAPSAPVDVEVPGYGEIVLEEIDASETEIKNGNSILVNAQDTLGGKLDSAFGSIDTINDDLSNLGDAVDGAIVSANGKNTVHFDDHAPGPEVEGVEGDTWFVGQVGRPNDVIEAVNEALNPSFTSLGNQLYAGQMYASSGTAAIVTSDWSESGDTALEIRPTSTNNTTAVDCITRENPATAVDAGRTITISANIHLPAAQTGSQWSNARRIIVRTSSGGSINYSFALSSQAPNAAGSTRLSVTFTLPEQLDYWYFMLGNGSSSTRVYWDSLRIGGSTYFDGDTEDGETDNDPHYRWTGEPHASPSEKYLPATEGLSDKWNVTEQYRHDGTGWVQVELSHNVISSVDIGALTAGSAAIKEAVVQKLFAEVVVARMSVADEFIGENAILTGAVTAPKITASEELWAKLAQFVTVYAEMIDSDAFNGRVFTGNTYLTSDGNGEFADRGLFFQKPDGTAIFRVPTDGTPISMSASDVQIERAQVDELELNYGQLRSGGSLTLNAGVTPPASPPELNASWPRVVELPSPGEGVSINGFTAWGNKWVRALNVRGVAEGDRLEIYTPDGEVETSIPLTMNPHNGCTVIGDVCYVLGHQHGRPVDEQRVHGYDLTTGERVTNWVFTRFYASNQKPISIGNDGSNILVAGVAPEVVLYVMRYNPTTGAQIGSDMVMSSESPTHFTVNGVSITGGKLYVSAPSTVREYVESGGAWSFNGFVWDNPNKDGAGFVWKDDRPFVVDGSGAVREGSGFASDTTVQACYTWFDGTHETTPSPIATVAVGARSAVALSTAIRTGLMKRVYLRKGTTGTWARYDIGENATSFVESDGAAGHYQLPTSNSFPNSTPSVIKSSVGNLEFRGDGSGSIGPLTFGADGSMTGLSRTAAGRVIMTPTSENQTISTFVTFPAGRFTTAPSVVATPDTTVPGSTVLGVGASNPSATGFYLYFRRTSVAPTGVTWIAMEMD